MSLKKTLTIPKTAITHEMRRQSPNMPEGTASSKAGRWLLGLVIFLVSLPVGYVGLKVILNAEKVGLTDMIPLGIGVGLLVVASHYAPVDGTKAAWASATGLIFRWRKNGG